MKCSLSHLVLAASLTVMLTPASQAAPKSPATSKGQVDTYNAREKCISEAIAAVPGTPAQENGITAQRTSRYVECARRMGFKP
jgi:hypothetical protein